MQMVRDIVFRHGSVGRICIDEPLASRNVEQNFTVLFLIIAVDPNLQGIGWRALFPKSVSIGVEPNVVTWLLTAEAMSLFSGL
jgi:hypothetical protein